MIGNYILQFNLYLQSRRVVFTMALVISISYSISNSTAIDNATSPGNLSVILRESLGFAPGSTSHASFSNTVSATVEPNYILIRNTKVNTSKSLSRHEYMQGLRASERAIKDRLFADMIAAKSPLPSPSPESRHRYAVSTYPNVSALALAAIGEIAATRTIENMR